MDCHTYRLATAIFIISLHLTRISVTADYESNFFSENFIVGFRPFVSKSDNETTYDQYNIRPMVEQISEKFQNIFVPSRANLSLAFVAPEVAHHNHEIKTSSKRLKVYLAFTGYQEYQETSIENVLSQANESNYIFSSPKTVEYIIAQEDTNSASFMDTLLASLKHANCKIEIKSMKGYKLGAVLPLNLCKTDGNDEELKEVLRLTKLVLFESYLNEDDIKMGFENTAASLTKQFEKCKEVIRKLNSSTEVGFKTGWSNGDGQESKAYSSLVAFWGKMNHWSRSTNTKLFMMEAFDQPSQKLVSERNQGWWKLKSNVVYSSSHNSSYMFQDKFPIGGTVEARKKGLKLKVKSKSKANRMATDVVSLFINAAFVGVIVMRGV